MDVPGDDSFDRAKRGVLRALYDRTDDSAIVLATTFDTMRTRVGAIASTIGEVMPDFTDHSLLHLDSLWDYVRYLLGDEAVLNPGEAFVLGGAILLHDLAMTPSAYPGGFPGPDGERELRDLVASELRRHLERRPTEAEVDDPPREIRLAAVRAFLRRNHATGARLLATGRFVLPGEQDGFYVIGDQSLREHYGPLIGTIAESHWWDHDTLESRLRDQPELVAPPVLGGMWPVKPLRMACLLRCADAAHLDNRRADKLRRYLQGPSPSSATHWDFQERISSVGLRDGRLVYQAPSGFPIENAPGWWLGYRTLRDVVDRELQACHDILVKAGLAPFQARGVHAIESPRHFAEVCPTHGWTAVDTEIKVADTHRLIELLGGAQLYGDDPSVILRELVQNARDAILARREIDPSFAEGTITVRCETTPDGRGLLTVADDGVGMSDRTITNRLLVVGGSLWASEDVIDELPGLASSSFEAVGRFGIGFFSVSMIAGKVSVTTRHLRAGPAQTTVVTLDEALAGLPILRPAAPDEQRHTPGTEVRVSMTKETLRSITSERSTGRFRVTTSTRSIRETVRRLFPMLDCRLTFHWEDTGMTIEPGEWQELSGEELLDLCGDPSGLDPATPLHSTAVTLHDDDGEPFGRVAIALSRLATNMTLLTVGGIRATDSMTSPLVGLLRATSYDISRNRATTRLPARAKHDLLVRIEGWLDDDLARSDDERAVVHDLRARLTGHDDDPTLFSPGSGFARWSQLDPPLMSRDEVVIAHVDARFGDGLPSTLGDARLVVKRSDLGSSPEPAPSLGNLFISYSPTLAVRDEVWGVQPSTEDRQDLLTVLCGPVAARLVRDTCRAAFDAGGSIGPFLEDSPPPVALNRLAHELADDSPIWDGAFARLTAHTEQEAVLRALAKWAADGGSPEAHGLDLTVEMAAEILQEALASGDVTREESLRFVERQVISWSWPARFELSITEDELSPTEVIVIRPRLLTETLTGGASHDEGTGPPDPRRPAG